MEDNSKLFVFDKKEVVLIFVFIVLIAITSFTLGVRFGKQLSLKKDQYTEREQDLINLKSSEEETVESLTEGEEDKTNFEKSLEKKQGSEGELDTEARLRAEIERLSKNGQEMDNGEVAIPKEEPAEASQQDTTTNTIENTEDIYRPEGNLSGKYTIQLAAFDSKEEAQSFADGFIVSGHDAIINEVEIPGKGTWYRVSIGLFDDINKAKEYLEKEKSFFQGKDYLINKIE